MRIAVHYSDRELPHSYSLRWIQFAREMGIDVLQTDFLQPGIIERVRSCNGVMWHWNHLPDDKQTAPRILDSIETGLRIPVFPNRTTRWHYDEKISQSYLFDALKVSKIKSWIFYSKRDAIQFIESAGFPLVFKLSVGAGSANILKLEDKESALYIIRLMFGQGIKPYSFNEFKRSDKGNALQTENQDMHWYYLTQKNYVYFQEFLPGNEFDIRVTVIGNRAFGFIRHNRNNDFRASGSGNIDYDTDKIPTEAVELSHFISRKNNFQSMAYDFLFDKSHNLVISEISYCYNNLAVYNCPGFWDRDLTWHKGHIWPEEVQVSDFLYYLETGMLI
jgi:hypothetical protein